MTAGLPYLRNLRKTDLVELAENSKLKNYIDMKKSDLEVALDKHLWSNRSKLQNESSLTDYFRRAGNAAAQATGVTKTPARTPARGARSRGKAVVDNDDNENESDSSSSSSSSSSPSPLPITPTTTKLAKRYTNAAASAASAAANAAPTSPHDIKRMAQSTASYLEPKSYHLPRTEALLSYLSSKYHGAYAHVASCIGGTDIASYFRLAREYAGSAWSINAILLAVEVTGVARNLIPSVQLFDFSRFKLWLFKSPLTAVYTFDPAFFFTKLFWGVGSLWLVIGVLVPLMFAYVFNPSVGANLSSAGGAVGQRKSRTRYSGGKTSFDPLIFALSRGCVMHFVLRTRGRAVGMDWVWSPGMVEFLGSCLPGGMSWVLVRSVIGVVVSLYEAVLRK